MLNIFYQNRFKTKRAFTLIEMLIVISIVGMIAGLALASYGSIRQQAKLDIAADSLITAFKEQGGKAKSGQHTSASHNSSQQSVDIQFSCFGLHLQKNAPFVQYAVAPYISANSSQADVCDTDHQTLSNYDFMEEVQLQDINVNETPADSLDVFFKPPFGKSVASTDGSTFSNFSKIVLTIGLQNSTEKRTLEIDGLTGEVKRIQNPS